MDLGQAVPNALTLSRLPLAAVFWIAPDWPPFAFTVLGLATLTDVADGFIARRVRSERWKRREAGAYAAGTGRGPWLDAFCDKVFVVSVVTAVWLSMEPPAHLAVLVVTREILVLPLSIGYRFMPEGWRREYDFTAGWPGKLATGLQLAAICLAILNSPYLPPVAVAAAVAGGAAVGYYLLRAWRTGRH